MKALFLFITVFLFTQLLAQKTHYRFLSNGLKNVVLDMELKSDKIYLSSASQKLINPNQLNEYTTVSLLNLEGTFFSNLEITNLNTKKFVIFDSIHCFNRLSKYDNNFIVSGHEAGKDQETKFHIFDTDLIDQKEFSITSVNADRIGNEGIFVDDSILYSYGLLQKEEVLYANIIKYNLNTNTIVWDKNYKKGKRLNQMWDLQKTKDGNLIFMMYHKDADAGSASNSGYQILKIDTDGEIIDSFSHSDLGADKQRILASRNGDIFYTTEDNPFDPIFPSHGRINKLSENMDTILWSLELPSNAFTNGNRYKIFDYIQANNGDIMACGKVWHMPGGPLVAGPNATWNGFVTRVSQNGELKWSRIYRLPNDNPKLPNGEYGNFRAGQLDKILETEDGNFVLGGTAYYSSVQLNSGQLQFGDTLSSMWIMVVDENGCIEGEECEEVIHLDSKNDIKFNIDDKWIYEQEEYFGGGNSLIDFVTFQITDTFSNTNIKKYLLDETDTVYIDNNKMYFWDSHYNEYIMYYDFDETSSYEIKYYDPFRQSDEIATIVVDSISYKLFGVDLLKTQHIHILNSGTSEEYQEVVYEGIGAGHFGIKFLLGCGLCDFNPYTTKLRCFSNKEKIYNFVDYACDSTWLLTNTSDIKIDDLEIYPNPTDEIVNINGLSNDVPYEIFTIDGKLFKKGMTKNYSLSIEDKGFYIVRLYVSGAWISKKIVKIE